jgi:hypothetical protein
MIQKHFQINRKVVVSDRRGNVRFGRSVGMTTDKRCKGRYKVLVRLNKDTYRFYPIKFVTFV